MRMLVFIVLLLLVSDPERARQANEAYNRGDYAEAEAGFRDAIREHPDDARLHFNLGNALARQGKFDEAVEAYTQFRNRAETPQQRAMADYNIGNILGEQQQWQEAIEQYRKSLREHPADEDAVHNFEYALRQLQEQQQQQEQQQDQDSAGQSDQRQQQDGDEQDEREQQQQQQESPADQDADGEQDQQPQDLRLSEMTQEEAEQLLNAITNREKDLIRDFLKDQVETVRNDEKDW